MGACGFLLTADSTVHIKTDASAGGECKHGKQPITFAATGCHVEIGEQALEGVTYHNIETGAKAITLKANSLEGIEYNSAGANCNYGTTANGLFTTGNADPRGGRAGRGGRHRMGDRSLGPPL